MKIAVCMFGQYRTGKLAYKNIRNFFGDLYEKCDFFIHTWNINSYRTLKSLHNTPTRPDELLSSSELVEYRDLYNAKSFLVDNFYGFRKDITTRFGQSGALIYLYHSQYYSVELMKIYENSMKFKYDIIVFLRPDILFDPSRQLSTDINELITQGVHILTIKKDDVYLLGHRNEMVKASEFYKETECCRGAFNWLLGLYYDYLDSQNIKYASMLDSRFTIMRREFDYIDPLQYFNQLVYLNTCIYSGTVNYSYNDLISEFKNEYDQNNSQTISDLFDNMFGKNDADILRKKNI
jgi:hypothetical protein